MPVLEALSTFLDMSSDMTFPNTSVLSTLHTGVLNESGPAGCITLRQNRYSPEEKSDSIVSVDVANFVRQLSGTIAQVLFLIGGPANVINMVVFFKQGLKDRVNLLLFSLAITDALTLICAMFYNVEDFIYQFTGDAQMGPIFVFFMNSNLSGFSNTFVISFLLSAMIACERCYCVLRPLQYQTVVRTRTVAFIIVTVSVSVLSMSFVATLRFYIVCTFNPNTGIVSNMIVLRDIFLMYKDVIDIVANVVLGAIIPGTVMLVAVTSTAVTAWRLQQIVAWRAETTATLSSREVALTRMLIGTSLLLIACMTPGCLWRLAQLFLPEMNVEGRYAKLFLTGAWLYLIFIYINATFNFFIYFGMGSRYRDTFWTLFHCKRTGRQKTEKSNHCTGFQ